MLCIQFTVARMSICKLDIANLKNIKHINKGTKIFTNKIWYIPNKSAVHKV